MTNNQEKIERLNLVLRAIRSVNQLLVKEKNRDRLLKGICQILIKNRSYFNIWISIFGSAGKLVASAQAGIGEEFQAMMKLLKRGELPDCVRRALSQQGVVVTEDPATFCADCPLSKYYKGRGGIAIRVEHNGRIYGAVCVSTPKKLIVDSEEKSLLEELAKDLAFALHSIELEEDHNKADELLQEAEKRYRSVFENTGAATLIIEEDMTISMVNARFEQFSGYTKKDVEGRMKLTQFAMDEDRERLKDYHIKRRRRGGDVPTEYEFNFTDKYGKRKNIFCKIGMIPGTKTSVASWVDITSRKQAEEALSVSERRFRDLVENSPIGISIIQDGRVIYRNPTQKRLLGPLPLTFSLLEYENIHHEDIEKVKELYMKISSGEIRTMETDFRFYPPDKINNKSELKWVHCRANIIEYQGKEAVLLNIIDMTQPKELERLLMIQDKMASLGRVAAGIAHEIRNPLTAVNMYLDILNNTFHRRGDMESEKETVGRLQSASNKIESVIRRVMDFSKPSEPRYVLKNINHPIEEALKLSSVALRKNGIKIDKTLAENLPRCKIDQHLIEEVILNLINNALEAMRNMDKNKKIDVTSLREGDFVLVRIADSGPGVPLDLRNAVFEPFYTTKKDSTGIGLSLVHRIITDHGGSIDVRTSKWRGAEFRIKIPISKVSKKK